MKFRNIILFTVGLGLLVIAVFSLSDDILSPYVPFREAKSNPGKYVQIIGRLDRTIPVQLREGELVFSVIDREGNKLDVTHRGAKPQNFEHTEQVVMIGKYDSTGGIFKADRVLVKCPSKYRRKQ
ncbi:MAG: cytochrome c maturation protein CcmE [Spirochaetes bacterium]|nr:cytochrome c maturation protein CcmE [Spirochaetota bacterium]